MENRFDVNDTFAYITGYTSGGAPYGVAWEDTLFSEDTENHGRA